MSQPEFLLLPLIIKDNATKYYVNITSKKGKTTETPIHSNLIGFDTANAQAGMEVSVEMENGIIQKVTIPGQAPPQKTQPPQREGRGRGGHQQHGNRPNNNHQGHNQQPVSTNSLPQGNPQLIGMPFHNPYTFIPFVKDSKVSNKVKFTPRTIDESDNNRFTGVIELEITTLSPLMTNGAIPQIENGHKTYSALTIDDDVIVPATGVRGFLRNLLTIITGGPLTTVDEGTFLCQGRDLQLGSGKANVPGYRNVYLGRVVEAGSHKKPGKIERGETRLVEIGNRRLDRPDSKNPSGKIYWVDLVDQQIDPDRPALREIRSIAETEDAKHCWRLKLSGRPVGGRNARKFEGVFKGSGDVVDVPSRAKDKKNTWAEYLYRNRHGVKNGLKGEEEKNGKKYPGDLVWLEINESDNSIISIQWARWGRRGMSLKDAIPAKAYPDYLEGGDTVSCVTNLFGQVPINADNTKQLPNKSFAGRIRPDNLVFLDAKSKVKGPDPLAVLSSPHPGCIAFYRNSDDPTRISSDDQLRGYKVYRTSNESQIDSPSAPWKFENQGIFDNDGKIHSNSKQKSNISAQLLPNGQKGKLKLSVRALNQEELALLLLACNATWRLGGGKPLGLGHCQAKIIAVYDENGNNVLDEKKTLLQEYDTPLLQLARKRLEIWGKTQKTVKKLRYPRAVVRNNSPKNSRSGLSWFTKFAKPKTNPDNENAQIGLTPVTVTGKLKDLVRQSGVNNSNLGADGDLLAAQPLPFFNPDNPEADLLYGYDVLFCESNEGLPEPKPKERERIQFNGKRDVEAYPELAPFDENRHVSGHEQSQANNSQNAETRQDQRRQR